MCVVCSDLQNSSEFSLLPINGNADKTCKVKGFVEMNSENCKKKKFWFPFPSMQASMQCMNALSFWSCDHRVGCCFPCVHSPTSELESAGSRIHSGHDSSSLFQT